jgi:hypothetical protein
MRRQCLIRMLLVTTFWSIFLAITQCTFVDSDGVMAFQSSSISSPSLGLYSSWNRQTLSHTPYTSPYRVRSSDKNVHTYGPHRSHSRCKNLQLAAQPSQPLSSIEVKKRIDKVVLALRKDARANKELGKLQRVTTVLGSGLQQMGTVMAVRFNASFQKSGPGISSIPLPFGLGQSNVSEGRGTMVGQVKASINVQTGKVISCSVFRDLGYGRTFDLKV